MKSTKKLTIMALCLALSLVLSYVEVLIPYNFGIPGIKLGLANSLILFMIVVIDFKSAAIVGLLRIVLSGILFGNFYSVIYSLCGGLLSMVAMILFVKLTSLSISTISMVSAMMHNIGQIIVACILLETAYIAGYLPALLVSATVTGTLIGILTSELIKRLGTFVRAN